MANEITPQDYLTEEEKRFAQSKQTNQEAADKSLSSLGTYKDNALSMYANNQKNAQQGAYVANQTLLKYLPEQQAAAGLGALGTSQSTLLQANNQYKNQVGGINSNYDNMRRVTLADYATKKTDVLDTLYNRNLAAEQDYRLEKDNRSLEASTNAQNLLQLYLPKYTEDGVFDANEQSELNAILQQYRTPAGERYNEVDNMLQWYAKEYAAAPAVTLNTISEGIKADTKNSYIDKAYLNSTFKILSEEGLTLDEIDKKGFFGYAGQGYPGSGQQKRVTAIKDAARRGVLQNGTVVDFNNGLGTDFYIYHDGRFYKAKKT